MKILHIISSGGMYGAEAVILNMSRTLNTGPHHSTLAVFSNSSQPNLELHKRAAAEGIESHAIPCKGQFDSTVPAAIRTLMDQTGADIVHAHGYKADVYVYLALRKSKTPIVSTCHTWYDTDLFLRAYGALDRLVLRAFDGVVAVSDEVRQRLLNAKVPEARVRLIRNGVDLRQFDAAQRSAQYRQADRPLTVGLIGRLSWEKNVELFIQAAAGVLVQLPSTMFIVVGDGPDRPKLEALISDLGIRDHVSLLGRIEDMPAIYSSVDLAVSSSRQEGLPIAILEAMASSLPVVATSVGAVPGVVHDGVTGLLVPSEDAVAMTNSIISLLRDPQLRHRYGASARQRIADEFSADRMTAEYLRLYEDVLHGRAAKHDA